MNVAIKYSDKKKAEWDKFKKHGGTITFEIDPEDISSNKEFESYPSIKNKLTTGFEIPPTTLIDTPQLQAIIQIHGTAWDYILSRVYLAGGKVIYKKLPNNKYEAICTVPSKQKDVI